MDPHDDTKHATASQLNPLLWGPILNLYDPIKKLGNGAQGEVIRARSKETGEIVAIKRITDALDKFHRTKTILREIKILNHLRTLRGEAEVFPFTTVEQVYLAKPSIDLQSGLETSKTSKHYSIFIVMEAAHITFEELMDNAKTHKVKEKHIRKMAYQLLQALRILHQSGVLHRDLKPANVLIDTHYNIKVADFGLARSVGNVKLLQSSMQPSEVMEACRKDRARRRSAKRKLSNHVVTRFYRAPEIILLEQEYDSGVDIWSFGCILGELVTCQKQYVDSGADVSARQMFTGDSCYPLSPAADSEDSSDGDQLRAIMDILGFQCSEDFSFITEREALKYAISLNCEEPPIQFDQEFQLTNPDLAKLLHEALQFNFHLRTPAHELSQVSLFDDVRIPHLEAISGQALKLDVDQADAYDYGSFKAGSVSVADLRCCIEAECRPL